MDLTTTPAPIARLGNGAAMHLTRTNASGYLVILCNEWGTVNGSVRSPKIVAGATEADCKRCLKIAAA